MSSIPNDNQFDPEEQAESVAKEFEFREEDRWLRLHSWTYRHLGFFAFLSVVMMGIGGMGMFVDDHIDQAWRYWTYLVVMDMGLLLVFLVAIRAPGSRGFRLPLLIIGLVGIMVTIVLPFLL